MCGWDSCRNLRFATLVKVAKLFILDVCGDVAYKSSKSAKGNSVIKELNRYVQKTTDILEADLGLLQYPRWSAL